MEPMYPDVLGAITGGARVNIDKLQCALGVFPRRTYLYQPSEVVLVLQNMVDQKMKVTVAMQLPIEDLDRHAVVMEAPQTTFSLNLSAGEVGVLRMPIMALPPTPAGSGYPVRVAVRYRAPEGRAVRLPGGGAPPSLVNVSPIKFQVFRDIEFAADLWLGSTDILTTYFDIVPRQWQVQDFNAKPRYDVLWTRDEMKSERLLVAAQVQKAQRVAATLTQNLIYAPLLYAVEERYVRLGYGLHPGEGEAIAKLLTYTLDFELQQQAGHKLQDALWFQTLCQVLAHDTNVANEDPGDIAATHLFEAALYDAILQGFALVEPVVSADIGSQAERVSYANRLLTWMVGQGAPSLNYIYLPLVMGGVLVNHLVHVRDQNPLDIIDNLRRVYSLRSKMLLPHETEVFDMLTQVLDHEERTIRGTVIRRLGTTGRLRTGRLGE